MDAAELLLESGTSRIAGAAAFHAQQAAEKSIKGMLVRLQVEFPKTHDIGELVDLLWGVDPGLAETLSGMHSLSPFAVEGRYPGDLPDVSVDGAREAVGIARRAVASVLSALEDYLGSV